MKTRIFIINNVFLESYTNIILNYKENKINYKLYSLEKYIQEKLR